MASLCKLLELLAQVSRPLSQLAASCRARRWSTARSQCPWALKGTVMRVLNERFTDRDVDLRDGIKVFDDRGWFQVLPDPDEPLVHLYAEGTTEEVSEELEARSRRS